MSKSDTVCEMLDKIQKENDLSPEECDEISGVQAAIAAALDMLAEREGLPSNLHIAVIGIVDDETPCELEGRGPGARENALQYAVVSALPSKWALESMEKDEECSACEGRNPCLSGFTLSKVAEELVKKLPDAGLHRVMQVILERKMGSGEVIVVDPSELPDNVARFPSDEDKETFH